MSQWRAVVLGLFGAFIAGGSAAASDLEDLARQGFGVVETTNVAGEFNGCDFGRRISLSDGMVFVCETYQYSYAYAPEVLILKSVRTGVVKVLIDGAAYDGRLYRGG